MLYQAERILDAPVINETNICTYVHTFVQADMVYLSRKRKNGVMSMPMYMCGYLIELEKPSAEDMDVLLSKIDNFNYNNRFMLPYPDKNSDKVHIVFVLSEKRKQNEIRKDLIDVFGQPVQYQPFNLASMTDKQHRVVQTAKRLLANQHCRGNISTRFSSKSTEKCLKEIDDITGFGSFKDACRQMCIYHSNAKRLGKNANYNLALVLDCKADTDIFVEHIFDLYASLGIITDPSIASGDVDDAVYSDRDTAYLFVIEENWLSYLSDHLIDTDLDRKLTKLCRRDTIYIAICDRRQYEKLVESDGFMRLFPQSIEIGEINKAETMAFIKREAADYGFEIDENSIEKSALIESRVESIKAQIGQAVKRNLSSGNCTMVLTASDFAVQKKTVSKSAMNELEALIGLSGVKSCIKEITAFLKNRGKEALPSLHMVFRGNPGTGKTTVARLIGRIFGEIGILKNPGLFIEADRNTLVSKYLGGTASQTAAVIRRSQGGVLFIDEAYALNNGEKYDYGNEAVAVLVKQMEDYRKDFVCIMAGYTDEMNHMLDMNPGLRERVQFYVDFPDYSTAELTAIFSELCRSEKYSMSIKAKALINDYFSKIVEHKDKNFANGRVARKVFERIRLKQALRTKSNIITAADVGSAFADDDLKALCSIGKTKSTIGFIT